MQIQKGLVKYKDRSDIICTYGITADGGQYYFLDGYKLANNNVIATPTLVEAIDPTIVSSSIGLIDCDGKVIIPFENKSIKPINDNVLLVEKAVPITQSVLDAIKMRSDPLAATKLVTTPATIKDKMNAKMGSEGRFVFNDQFSEATVCDINGNNLIDNQFYSFIGIANDKLYFCKNTIDSEIFEYALNFNNDNLDEMKDTNNKLDVNEVSISRESIDEAINKEMEVQSKDSVDEVKDESVSVDNSETVETNDVVVSSKEENIINEEIPLEIMEKNDEMVIVDDPNKDIFASESSIDLKNDMNSQDVSLDNVVNINDYTEENKEENPQSSSNLNEVEPEIPFDSILKEDSILTDDYTNNVSEFEKDTIIEDTATTLSNLIKLNKSQKKRLEVCEDHITQLNAAGKRLAQKNKQQTRDMELLQVKLKNYETIVSKLEAKNHNLNNKIQEYEKKLAKQDEELRALRPQIAGKNELAKLLADAHSLLDDGETVSNNKIED